MNVRKDHRTPRREQGEQDEPRDQPEELEMLELLIARGDSLEDLLRQWALWLTTSGLGRKWTHN